MKIAIITPTFPPYFGGIGKVAYYQAKELRKLGYEVIVFTPKYSNTSLSGLEELPFKVIKIKPLFKYGNAAFIPQLIKELKNFDLIHLHYPFFGGAELIWLKNKRLKKQGAKIIIHYHMDVVGQGWLKYFFTFHNKFILPKIIKSADLVIVTSLDYAKNSNISDLIKKNPDKFKEVPCGVDINVFSPQEKDQNLLEKYQIKPLEKIILFVGGLDKAHYFKGVEYLIQAVNLLKEKEYYWRLIIVGEGELKSLYQDLAGQLALSHRIIFPGYISENDLVKFYNLADLVVLPSIDKSEAFGMVLIEAMACRKPVVASNIYGVRTVVDDGINGLLVQLKDFSDLASKIHYLLTQPEVAQQFGEKGLEKVKEKYSWEKIGQELDRIFRHITYNL